MGISSITSTNTMSVTQMTAADVKDQKSKNIQSDITTAQQQMQKLSSKDDLSANEIANERKKLQKEISGLNTKLKQHQEELRRSQKREIMMAELLEDKKTVKEETPEDKIRPAETSSETADKKNPPTDEQQSAQSGTVITQNNDGTVILKETVSQSSKLDTDTENKQADETDEEVLDIKETKTGDNDTAGDVNLSVKEMHAMVSADSSLERAGRLGTIIAKTRDGIAILKGEINQDKNRSVDTERKQAELAKMERREQQAAAFQSSILSEANNAMKSAAKADVSAKGSVQAETETTFYISGLNAPQEEQAAQQKFYVSFA